MHTGIGSVFSHAHFTKVTKIFAGLPLFGFFGFLAFVILENLLGFPVIYIGALVRLPQFEIVFHALYYTRLGLDCQGLNPENIVLALLAHTRDGILFPGQFITERGILCVTSTGGTGERIHALNTVASREFGEESFDDRVFLCCFHACIIHYPGLRVKSGGAIILGSGYKCSIDKYLVRCRAGAPLGNPREKSPNHRAEAYPSVCPSCRKPYPLNQRPTPLK